MDKWIDKWMDGKYWYNILLMFAMNRNLCPNVLSLACYFFFRTIKFVSVNSFLK